MEFDIRLTTKAMYDFMLYHTYTGFTGIFGTALGVVLLLLFFQDRDFMYLFFGIIFIVYIPLSLYGRTKGQISRNPAFKEPLHYSFLEEGIQVSQKESKEIIKWEQLQKAVSTGTSIIVYTSKVNAFIFPRKELDDKVMDVVEFISAHMEPKKVKIRY